MKIIKRCIFTILLLTGLVIVAPLFIIQYGPAGWATTSKVMLNMVFGYGAEAPSASTVRQALKVADGFAVSLYAADLGKVRFLKVTDAGDLLFSRPRSGEILLLERDRDGDGLPDGQRVLLAGLTRPHGLDIADGWLYVAESDGVGKIAFDSAKGDVVGDYQRIVSDLGDNGNHWTKTIRAATDGWLYLSAGSTCNVCEERDPMRATIMRFRPDGSEFSIYASGLRNSVGLDWAPWDNSLYATDNGRDLLGDDIPPCELNRIQEGGFYGWPYVNASELDPDYGSVNPAAAASNIAPSHAFRAHNAPLGIRFLRHNRVVGFERAALVALHGSWNRSVADGYKVVSLHWQSDGSIVERDFLSGFLGGEKLLGRPVDIAEASDGTIYISDDYSGSIYQITARDAGGAAISPLTLPQRQGVAEVRGLASYTPEQRGNLVARGERVYQSKPCSSCHALDLSGNSASAIPLVDLDERYTVADLADFFTAPTPPMPMFPLSAADREALAVYLLARP